VSQARTHRPTDAGRSRLAKQDAHAILASVGILGRSARILDVMRQVDDAAQTSGGVIILGEPGTGRGLVARAIHAVCCPPGAPFVAVYCDKVDPMQIDAELFGTTTGPETARSSGSSTHERIASGSLLHGARGGTVYFRRLEELPDRVQARLAHLLHDRTAVTDGSPLPEPFDVHPMTAVDLGFETEVAEGRVRHDLYEQFAKTTITVPPLRQRREDIPALAAHFVGHACGHTGIPVKTLDSTTLAVLSALPWRGNGRELQALMDRLVLETDSDVIGLDALLGHARLDELVPAPGHYRADVSTLREALEQFEKDYIVAVLAEHDGRVPEAARALGIQRANLYRKLRTLQIAPPAAKRPAGHWRYRAPDLESTG
jgi:two-component system nitrogen regulation response regulator NtrX